VHVLSQTLHVGMSSEMNMLLRDDSGGVREFDGVISRCGDMRDSWVDDGLSDTVEIFSEASRLNVDICEPGVLTLGSASLAFRAAFVSCTGDFLNFENGDLILKMKHETS